MPGSSNQANQVVAVPVLVGLHHDTEERHKRWKTYIPGGSEEKSTEYVIMDVIFTFQNNF